MWNHKNEQLTTTTTLQVKRMPHFQGHGQIRGLAHTQSRQRRRRRERHHDKHLAFVGNLALAFFAVSCFVLFVCLSAILTLGGKGNVSNVNEIIIGNPTNLRLPISPTSIFFSMPKSKLKQKPILFSDSLPIVQKGHTSTTTPSPRINKQPIVTQQFQRYTVDAPECTQTHADNVSFTLVTQFSVDRLWMMQHHCQRWGPIAPISVAVLTNQTTQQTKQAIVQLGCNPDTLSVDTMETNAELESDYPVNSLRTIALSHVRTSHVMYVDIDFWGSSDLHAILNQKPIRQVLSSDPKQTLVVPAFQLKRQCREYRDCPDENIPKMPQTQAQMIKAVLEKQSSPFDPTNRGGHGSTLYSKWIHQQPGELLDIPCICSNRYEPYLAFRYCRDLPPFQTQFSGYGKNKMTWVMQLRREGYIFSQLGGAFVVHYPHLDSASRMEWNQGPAQLLTMHQDSKGHWVKKRPNQVHLESPSEWTQFKRGKVDAVFVQFKAWMQSHIEDRSRVPMCDEREDDDARLWIDRLDTES